MKRLVCRIDSRVFLFLILVFFVFTDKTEAQNGWTVEMLKPIASYIHPEEESLGKYGMSVEPEYSGTPNISIPLYTVREGSLELPISIYYDASGIKVSQASTFIGLGWNMTCGGSINHTIIGTDDFNTTNTYTYEYKKCKEFLNQYLPGYITNSQPIYYKINGVGRGVNGTTEFNDQRNLMYKMTRGFYNPDIFQANFIGHSLSFVFDGEDRHVIILNDNATKYNVEYNMSNSNWPEQITITDDKGVNYVFRAFEEYLGRKDSYYLTEMISAGGADHIYIEYDSFTRHLVEDISQTMYKIKDLSGDNQLHYDLQELLEKSGETSFSIPSNSTIFTKYYPKRIRTIHETIEFSVENSPERNGTKAIKGFSVISSNGNVRTHDIVFHHGGFKESEAAEGLASDQFYSHESYGTRLKLTGVDIDEQKYSFEYNEKHPLPSIYSMSRDYWGYYNGIINRSMIGTPRFEGHQIIDYMGESNRFASEEYSKTGILTKITYPTGGYSIYDYELNHFHDRYYYPSAERIPQILSSIHNISVVAATNTNHLTEVFSLDKETDVDLTMNVFCSNPDKYTASAHLYVIKDMVPCNVRYIMSNKSKPGQSIKEKIRLPAGHYLMTATVPHIVSDYSTTAHVCIHIPITDDISYDESIIDESGESVGAGLRIKSIKHYDGTDNKFVGGTKYNYYDGKLLIPTQNIEEQDLKFTINDNCTWPIKSCKLISACSKMKHQPFEFLGIPYVGYSKVIKTDISSDQKLGAQTVFRFSNDAYNINQGEKCFFNNSFNGKLTEKTILSSEYDTLYNATYKYSYSYNDSEVIKYHKTIPRFIDIDDLEIALSGCTKSLMETMSLRDILLNELTEYDLSTYPIQNRWYYPTKHTEKNYTDGKCTSSIITNYYYNKNNYRKAIEITTDGLLTKQANYWYPSDYKSEGCRDLISNHCVSTLTKVEQYKQGKFVGGEKYDFALANDIPIIKKISKIDTDSIEHVEIEITRSDACGNVIEYVDKSGKVTTLLWSFGYKFPIMEISGANYDKVCSCSSLIPFIGSKMSIDKEQLIMLHNLIMGKTGAKVRTFLYNPWYKVESSIEPNEKVTNYQYDTSGRIVSLTDNNENIISAYRYNYKNK